MSDRGVTAGPLPVVPAATVGGLAAALQMFELGRVLAGKAEAPGVAVEMFLDAPSRNLRRTVYRRRRACRFDHCRWQTSRVAPTMTVREALEKATGNRPARLLVEGATLVERWECTACRTAFQEWRFFGGPFEGLACPRCARLATPFGAGARDGLDEETVAGSPTVGELSLKSLGLRDGDIFAVRCEDGVADHYCVESNDRSASLEGDQADRGASSATLAIVGCGNIGSQVAGYVARLRGAARIILVDPDRYEAANLASQEVMPADIGRPKARVLAERICNVTPRCETVAFVERIERVPLGYFRDAILLGCVDSRAARQSINRMAWRVARAWIDAGIDPVAGRARVVTYLCENARPCLECAWDDEDYEAVEQEYPCTVAEAAAGSWPYDPNRPTRDPDPGCTDTPSDRSEPRYGAARETRREKGEEPQARRNEGHE